HDATPVEGFASQAADERRDMSRRCEREFAERTTECACQLRVELRLGQLGAAPAFLGAIAPHERMATSLGQRQQRERPVRTEALERDAVAFVLRLDLGEQRALVERAPVRAGAGASG